MKIAFCITRMDEYGGAQMHVRDLCLWLKSQGHKPIVLSGCPGKVSDFLLSQGIEFIEIPSLQRAIHLKQDYDAFHQLKEALKNLKPDIVTCHSSKAGLLGRLAAKSCKLPAIFTAHGWAFTVGVSPIPRAFYWIIEKFLSYFSDHIITVSEFDKRLALRSHIISSDKITAIHNGIPFIFENNDHHSNTDTLSLLMVARIGIQKDHKSLLMAIAKCLDQKWILNLVGGGDDSELRKMSEELQISDRVRFLGERSDIANILSKTDLFLLISHWEGLPLSILEAMRSGLPVIASDVGGVNEVVIHQKTGWLVPAGQENNLVTALRTLIPDRDRLIKMGIAGRQHFEKHFTFLEMAQKTLSVYKQVTKN